MYAREEREVEREGAGRDGGGRRLSRIHITTTYICYGFIGGIYERLLTVDTAANYLLDRPPPCLQGQQTPADTPHDK